MFQIARGSGATLSECPFSSKKRTSPKDFLNADHFKTLRQKEPGTSHIRVLFDKTSANNQSNFKKRSSSSLFQIARGSGATTRWMYFFFTKHSPLEGPKKRYKVFTPESTRITFCSYLTRPERAKRDFQRSTMKCSGACRCGTHRIPRKRDKRSSSTRILPM